MASTVYVENISTKTSEDEIKSFFSFCGKIQDISVKPTGNDTQSASVTFEKAAAAKTALLLDSTQLGPNSVHVKPAQSGGDSATEKAADEAHEGDHISQEQKPRARIVAEYLAHGYAISDKAIERALAADKQHGYSAKFLQTLQNLDSKTQASQKAQVVDQKLGLSNKALGAWAGLTSYFDKAQGTPTGQKLRAFYDQGNKTVMDVHNEARYLADLKKGQSGSGSKPTKEEADVHGVGDGKTQCNCGSQAGKCPCPEGQCACSGCAKAENGGKPSVEEANVHEVGNGKTQCNCGSVSGKCPCPEGQCACSGCAKAENGGKPSVEEANVHEVGNGKTQCNCGSVSGKCPCPEGKCACSGCAKDTTKNEKSGQAGDASYAAVTDPKQ
ncbi:hypothetical protein E8E12_003633 [Didymella heteroderae]|uniref:RRM domain-containing protein n=1 Tax=Didymella heteroderae TaxID=1769908 RepID=A0A9P5BZG0_9PLEO|nr:hypothetical protein E8E12_003633 [Didymella heteroderae]